jgi:hypothetical protein
VNTKEGHFKRTEVRLKHWRYHPDPVVDVAVIPWPFLPEYDTLYYPSEWCLTPALAEKQGVGIGNEVFLAGLYRQHAGRVRNVPIIRVGNVAAMPEEPVNTRRGSMEAYLVEIRSIAGISGSPVFVSLLEATGASATFHPEAQKMFFLLGLMHGRWDIRQLAPVMFEIDSDYLKQPLNSGIGVIVPATRILEVINSEEFVAERRAAVNAKVAQDGPTQD